ncbi:N-methyl-L-tryptophan oxidase [Corynebacterium flavescens]|uniref:Amino acid oxidase n=1 Tax=Corynebacterium flavescens TaxID=28028 RepID=A0A1L7CK42_CORFL|nr:N-methyl-L-tryptophan oxidase [Corynebacterium flavescens]APT86217.1 amino acid oxidase [Corynebacterium flavescens]KAA8724481.1 N-methyl-L-tryptophan oxidase [Corynebacterium flavescens]GEB97965.1 N-methyltryptophan oxidase [Corynebacterium flavescens]
MSSKKVVVIGLGTMGSMSLWQLSQHADVEAIGIEQFGLVHGYGAFTGESRLFRAAYQEGTKYVPILKEARSLWQELAAASGRQLFLNFGVISIGEESNAPFQMMLQSIKDWGLPHEHLSAADLRERFPAMDFKDTEEGVVDKLGGALRPELAVLSALEQARANGATIYEHEEVLAFEDTGSGVTVTTSQRTINADSVIVSAGAWTELVLPQLTPLLEVRKLALTWFLPKDLQLFQPDRLPCFIWDKDDFHVFGAPCVDGYSVKISGLDLWGGPDTERVEDADLRLERDAVSAFGRQVAGLFPGVDAEPNRYSVHFDTYTADKTPIIDRVGNVVVTAGFSGHGFKLSPAVGKLATALALGEDTALHHPDFRIEAHGPVLAAV